MSGIIIVGVDGSRTASKAAASAKDLAAALGASLHVVSAFIGDRTEALEGGSDRLTVSNQDAAERAALTVANSLGQDVKVTYSAARGRPADVLIKEAIKMDARIIVVGNRRMQGIGRVLGSVANSVAHNAHCDVYIANTYDAE